MDARVRIALLFLGAVLLGGTVGYRLIEGWTLLDSLYMTVITVSTVGFREAWPLTEGGKVFTLFLILSGVGSLAYAATKTTEALLEKGVLRRRRMQMEVHRVRDHVIVCGYGRMGMTVVDQLRGRGTPLVVVEKSADVTGGLEGRGILYVVGDATDETVLVEAGVERARALAAVLPHDADNLFVTLTARTLNRGMTIVARSSIEKNDAKMVSAGATRVLNPYRNGGRLLARQLLHPSVTEFIELISHWEGQDLGLEEVQIQEGSPLAGVPLRDAPIRREMDVIVVGIRRRDGTVAFNPASDLAPAPGEIILALGRRENLRSLEKLAEGASR